MNKQLTITFLIGLALGGGIVLGQQLSANNIAPDTRDLATPNDSAIQLNRSVLRYAPGAPQLSYLNIEPTESSPVPLTEALNGKLSYDEDATSRISSAIAGRITRVIVQTGQSVSKGQPLLWLDSPDFAQANADAAKADADWHQKQLAFTRARTLFDGGVLARKDLETADNELQQARAEQTRAHARLRNIDPGGRNRDGEFPLRSPINGILTERRVNPGNQVGPDAVDPLFVVSDLSRLWVIAEVAEKDLSKISPGQPVSIRVDAYPEQTFTGSIRSIGDVIDPQTRRVVVRCEVPNPQRLLKPEMFARLLPVAQGASLPRIPNSALVTQGLKTYVFVETSPGTLARRLVTLAFRGNEESYIQTGLTPGERVVTSGAILLNSELGGA